MNDFRLAEYELHAENAVHHQQSVTRLEFRLFNIPLVWKTGHDLCMCKAFQSRWHDGSEILAADLGVQFSAQSRHDRCHESDFSKNLLEPKSNFGHITGATSVSR